MGLQDKIGVSISQKSTQTGQRADESLQKISRRSSDHKKHVHYSLTLVTLHRVDEVEKMKLNPRTNQALSSSTSVHHPFHVPISSQSPDTVINRNLRMVLSSHSCLQKTGLDHA